MHEPLVEHFLEINHFSYFSTHRIYEQCCCCRCWCGPFVIFSVGGGDSSWSTGKEDTDAMVDTVLIASPVVAAFLVGVLVMLLEDLLLPKESESEVGVVASLNR
jgi:hypothetical protein